MIDLLLPVYRFNLDYAGKLVADVPDQQMCAQPVAGQVMNHAAFVLGHLAWASDFACGWLGREPAVSAECKELFAMGAKPLADRSRYPAKDVLLKSLADSHARLAEAVGKAAPEALAKPASERIRDRFPTVGHMLLGLMTSHEGSHLGQLSAWRRALGFPSVF